MPFIETEASVRYEVIDGKRVPINTPKTEETITNTETSQEYMSDAEADEDVNNPGTDTKREDISRSVYIKVAKMPAMGSES